MSARSWSDDEIVLLWCRDLHVCSDWDEALRELAWISNADEDWIDKVERIQADGTVTLYEGSEAFRLGWDAAERQRKAHPQRPDPVLVANVWVDHGIAESFFAPKTMADAEDYADRLRPFLGHRVSVLGPKARPAAGAVPGTEETPE